MKKITDLFLYSSFFISLCGLGLVLETYLLTAQPPNWPVALLIFFATLFLYNLDNLLPYKTGQQMVLSERKKWLLGHRKFLLGLVIGSGTAALGLFLYLFPRIPIGFILPVFLISILYSLPVIPFKGKTIPLRDVPFLKVFLVATVWAALTVVLPLLVAGENLNQDYHLLLIVRRFLFIFALTLLFDIRDYRKDLLTNTVTFPGRFGTVFTKGLSVAALLGFMGLVFVSESGGMMLALELSAVAAGLVVFGTEEDGPDYFFAILADGMMMLQFLVVCGFSG